MLVTQLQLLFLSGKNNKVQKSFNPQIHLDHGTFSSGQTASTDPGIPRQDPTYSSGYQQQENPTYQRHSATMDQELIQEDTESGGKTNNSFQGELKVNVEEVEMLLCHWPIRCLEKNTFTSLQSQATFLSEISQQKNQNL